MRISSFREPGRLLAVGLATLTLTTAATGLAYPADAPAGEPAIKTSTPRSAQQITNIDILKQQIRNYYGDPLGTGAIGADGNYARETRSVAAGINRYLSRPRHVRPGKQKAIVLDIDDTTLATWNLAVSDNWNNSTAARTDYVDNQKFVAVPGMVDLVAAARKQGYAIFYVTNRRASSRAASLGNLTADGIGVDAGFTAPTTLPSGEPGLFMRPRPKDYPAYLRTACAADPDATCTTVHLKTAHRTYIESFGYEIVANIGDQYVDLEGGHGGRTFKLPNPNGYSV
ncbi:HAD family acid phosphatase [Kribbella sp. NPDC051587]|uniref:HAD family acid phosphatase n=1 Tax=Kribbella sp. NPDC051587 TaxID=3364119 RepID=UPI003791559A